MVNENLKRPRAECFMCLTNVVVTRNGKLATHREQTRDEDSTCLASGMTVRVYSEDLEAWVIPRNYKKISLGNLCETEQPARLTVRGLVRLRKAHEQELRLAKTLKARRAQALSA